MPPSPGRRVRTTMIAACAAAGAAGLGMACVASPWPAALLIRGVFYRGARQLAARMTLEAPEVTGHRGLKYQDDGGTRRLDIYLPPERSGPVPVVFWIHGGAWISGSRRDVAPYLRMLAAQGFAAVGVDYSVAPGTRYPGALHQLSAALRYLQHNADRYGLDAGRIVLAGDSAGAQLAAQFAAAVTSPAYAAALGLTPSLPPERLRGVVLNCGVYDLAALSGLTGILGWGFRTALWSYTGTRRFAETEVAKQMSVLTAATSGFPPAFICGGNGDGLTAQQSEPFADRLEALGVPVTRRFWPAGHSPALPHEAQFQFPRPEAFEVLEETQKFLTDVFAADTGVEEAAQHPPVPPAPAS